MQRTGFVFPRIVPYADLICDALRESESGRMAAGQIYNAIEWKHPGIRALSGWDIRSIFATLHVDRRFAKAPERDREGRILWARQQQQQQQQQDLRVIKQEVEQGQGE